MHQLYGPLLSPSKFGGAGTLHIAGVGDKKFNVLSHFGITVCEYRNAFYVLE